LLPTLLNASSDTPAGYRPEISHFPSTTTAGTALIPRDRHNSSAARASAALRSSAGASTGLA
jgi:hypothetical protein